MKKLLALFMSILFLLPVLSGCSKDVNIKAESSDEKGSNEYETYNPENISDTVFEGNREFAFDIFKKLNEEDADTNIFISPFSISQVLAMIYNGAETTTKEAMEKVLKVSGLKRSDVNESFRNLISDLNQADKKVELKTGNSIWVRDGFGINEEFIKEVREYYQAASDNLDFNDPGSVDIINNWISEATGGKIEKMLTSPISEETVMFIINAIYFKGEWSRKFDPELTYEWNFSAYDGSQQKVDMMK